MADKIRKNATREAECQTDASVWKAIRYLDSPTDYRQYLPSGRHTGPFAESDFVMLDDSLGFDWRGLRDLALIALLTSIVLLLMLQSRPQ